MTRGRRLGLVEYYSESANSDKIRASYRSGLETKLCLLAWIETKMPKGK